MDPGRPARIGLVLGGGGLTGTAFHAGVIAGLAKAAGWDARTAEVIVGTSAGSTAAALLRAEVMGAEDAIRDLNKQLAFLSPPSTEATRERALEIAQRISRKRAFLNDANRKLTGSSRSSSASSHRNYNPQLTPSQKQRIGALALAIQPDTSYLIAQTAGRYLASSGDRPAQLRIGFDANARSSNSTQAVALGIGRATESYRLEPTGLPVLWAKARRLPLGDSTLARTDRALVVSPGG